MNYLAMLSSYFVHSFCAVDKILSLFFHFFFCLSTFIFTFLLFKGSLNKVAIPSSRIISSQIVDSFLIPSYFVLSYTLPILFSILIFFFFLILSTYLVFLLVGVLIWVIFRNNYDLCEEVMIPIVSIFLSPFFFLFSNSRLL